MILYIVRAHSEISFNKFEVCVCVAIMMSVMKVINPSDMATSECFLGKSCLPEVFIFSYNSTKHFK